MNRTQHVPYAEQEDTAEQIMACQEGKNIHNLLHENEKD